MSTETAKLKRVKLGPKALSFSDPKTRFKLATGQVVEVGVETYSSKKFSEAIKGGHIEYTDDEVTVAVEVAPAAEAPSKPKTKNQLIEEIMASEYFDEIDEDEADLKKLNLAQLNAIITENTEE